MKIDLSDLNPGDSCFFCWREISKKVESRVLENSSNSAYSVMAAIPKFGNFNFTIDGRFHVNDVTPMLFHSAQECADYFEWVAEVEK